MVSNKEDLTATTEDILSKQETTWEFLKQRVSYRKVDELTFIEPKGKTGLSSQVHLCCIKDVRYDHHSLLLLQNTRVTDYQT